MLSTQELARETLIDMCARRVLARQDRYFRMLWEIAELPEESRKTFGVVSAHEAEWRARQGL